MLKIHFVLGLILLSPIEAVSAQDSIENAKIEFNTNDGNFSVFSCPPGTQIFQDHGRAGASVKSQLLDAATYGLFRKKHKKTPIILEPPVGQTTSFFLHTIVSQGGPYSTISARCGIRFDLTPQKNYEYRALFTPGPGAGQCSIKLEQRILNNEEWLNLELQPSDNRCK